MTAAEELHCPAVAVVMTTEAFNMHRPRIEVMTASLAWSPVLDLSLPRYRTIQAS